MTVIVCLIFTILIDLAFMVYPKIFPARRKIKVKNFTGKVEPFYTATDGSVCADCYSQLFISVGIGERVSVPLGFALELPEMTEAVIRPRSGLSKKGIDVQIGTIDTDYRGEVHCTVANNSGDTLMISKEMRICQIAFRDVIPLNIVQVEKLSDTKRGQGGFGSTGV